MERTFIINMISCDQKYVIEVTDCIVVSSISRHGVDIKHQILFPPSFTLYAITLILFFLSMRIQHSRSWMMLSNIQSQGALQISLERLSPAAWTVDREERSNARVTHVVLNP